MVTTVCISKAVYISGFTFFCKIKLWGTKTMVNTCKERSLSYVFIVGQAKTKNMLDFPIWTVHVWLSWFYLNSYQNSSHLWPVWPILDSSKIFWIRPKMTFHNLCFKFTFPKRTTKISIWKYVVIVKSTVIHYLRNKVGVVDFANAQGLVMF